MIERWRRFMADEHGPLGSWTEQVWGQAIRVMEERPHGDMPRWMEAISNLHQYEITRTDLNSDRVSASTDEEISESDLDQLKQQLMVLHPWRKGPFEITSLHIDTEWRSDFKWRRIQPHLKPLLGRKVLDVGCGNGYYAWRMLGEGAGFVLGIDPTQLYVAQFEAIRHFMGEQHPVSVLPLTLEDLPVNMQAFDTVFSLGVFYHRRSPFDHLAALKGALINGGELVFETLVINGKAGEVLVPADRYAKMRNVWFIPSPLTLEHWLKRAGYKNIRMVDVSQTSTIEQRNTEWMWFESLNDFLDPRDLSKTIEGYPAPKRAIFTAET